MKKKLNCVLLIDDDEPTNYLHSWILENSGLVEKIHVAHGGQEALDYLSTSIPCGKPYYPCPDLIFLDINMPAMNGWEFLDHYRALDKNRRGKVILVMLTTSMFPEDEQRAWTMPEISGFESKPLTPEALENIIEKYFPDYA